MFSVIDSDTIPNLATGNNKEVNKMWINQDEKPSNVSPEASAVYSFSDTSTATATHTPQVRPQNWDQ